MTLEQELWKSDPKNFKLLRGLAYTTQLTVGGHLEFLPVKDETKEIYIEYMQELLGDLILEIKAGDSAGDLNLQT